MAAAEVPIYEQAERLAQLVPDWPELPIFVARTEIHFGSLDTARDMLNEYLADEPENPLALSVLAEVQIKSGEVELAKPILQRGLENARSLPPWLVDHLQWLETLL